ncbi:MAG: RidA family protein [Ignavibacteriaceae bacterium]|nr:RidA family protein [Ignavibacteriaceae bacterium]
MIEAKIKELGYILPEPAKPLAAYIPAIKIDKMIYTAGQLPSVNGQLKYKGKVGYNVSEEEGQKAAELSVLNCLSVIKSVCGDLDQIEQVIKVTVFVNSSDGFTNQPKVANGASELLLKIFGNAGKHVRSAVGVNELPIDAALEIEMVVKLK